MDEHPSSSMARGPVVIVGAGIGGLTLGRCLQRHRIPFTIYERADQQPRHNYGITLVQSTYQPLLEVLETSDHAFRQALAVVKVYKMQSSVADRTPEKRIHEFRANRSAFETLLAKPIKQHIKYSATFKSIRPAPAPGAQVEIVFDDDVVLQNDLVIDCSGVHSSIRTVLLPQVKPVIHPFVAINGKRYVLPGKWEDVYASEFSGKSVLQTNVSFKHEDRGVTRSIVACLEIAINDTVLDHADQMERVSISYTYSRCAFSDGDAMYVPDRAKEAAKDIPDQFFKEMASLVKSGTLSPAYVEAFNPSGAGQDRLLNWLLRSVHLEDSQIKALRLQGVLIIGDAACAEPIIGSIPGGANHVIGQAIRLADRLAVEWKSDRRLRELELENCLEPKPRSSEEEVAAHLQSMHRLEPAKAVL